MIKDLFLPATLLMNKLRFGLKFTLVVVLFFLPLLYLAFSYFSSIIKATAHTESELEAVRILQSLDQQQQKMSSVLVYDLNWRSGQNAPPEQAQRIQQFTTQLNDLLDPELLDEQQLASLRQQIEKFKTSLLEQTSSPNRAGLTPVDKINGSLSNLDKFNNFYGLVANMKQLTNDPEIDTVTLSRLVIEKRLIALNFMMRAFLISAYAVGEPEVSSVTFDALSIVSDQLANNIANVRQLTSTAEGQDPNLEQLILSDIDVLVKLLDDNLLFLEDQFLVAEEVTLTQSQLDEWINNQLAQFYTSKGTLYDELNKRLQSRINSNQVIFYTQVATLVVALLLIVYLFVGMSLSISMSTNSLKVAAIKLADGDTRVESTVRAKDELADAIKAFNQMASKVHHLVESVQQAAKGVAQQTEEVEQLSNQTGEAVTSQLQDTGAITNSIGELLSAVADVSNNTKNVVASLESANQESEQGRQTLAGALKAIDELGDEIKLSVEVINQLSHQSDSINQVLDVIKSIAEQTNLLALNAAIEAARAGDQGRGFAVVADEVRSLAKRTHESTEEIQTTISSLQDGVKNAVQAMTRSDQKANRSIEESAKLNAALDNISEAVTQISEQNSATEQATQQQENIASQIESSLASISQISTVTESNVHQSISASQQLAEYVAELEATIAKFKT
ncbi:methyl-accepting chemotaxis protein [Aliikangiella marina]|nr:methyl-accepting chemotaxis protein [Aliikangiella marina]